MALENQEALMIGTTLRSWNGVETRFQCVEEGDQKVMRYGSEERMGKLI